jgi:integrase
MPRRGTYLFKRKGSNNWWLRFQYSVEFGRTHKVERSLGTSDRTEAEILAADAIKAHKRFLLTRRAQAQGTLKTELGPKYEPGKQHTLADGTRVFATDEQLFYLDDAGVVTRTEPNGKAAFLSFDSVRDQRELGALLPKQANTDDAIIETWIKHRSLSKHIVAEAYTVWELFKQITHEKPLRRCSRDDGRKLVAHLFEAGNKSQTVAKKLSHLCAAVNLAIDEGKLTFNPFANIAPKADDGIIRLPLGDDDMALVRSHLHELREEDQLLWKWLAMTGMRLEEPFQVSDEYKENGIRYVIVGTKTTTSKRRVPLPDALLSSLPAKIEDTLFTDTPETAAKRLRYFLKRLEISHDSKRGTGDPRKVVHSLRHRAKDKLRAVRCPLDIQYELLGHEVKTVASGYGRGYPVAELKDWMEKIGF